MPSESEQEIIIQLIEHGMSSIEKLEQGIDENIERSEALRQSILKKAFSGQLVPQDPNDEPASELLKRIAAEKAILEVQKKSTTKLKKRKRA